MQTIVIIYIISFQNIIFITRKKASVDKFYINIIVQLIVYIITILIKINNITCDFFL